MNTLRLGFLLLFNPTVGWQKIAEHQASTAQVLLLHTVPFALIPAACWYYGVTHNGWSIAGDVMRLTSSSALPMCILFFFAMVVGVAFLGFMVLWMSETYGDKAELGQSVKLISYTATPFFLFGVLGLYPLLWLDIILGTVVACYCIYLLYTGVSTVMRVDRSHGFLYASAIFAVALVSFVGLLTATVLLWEYGPKPEYTY